MGSPVGLQLSDCTVDAEIFVVERLVLVDPFPQGPALMRLGQTPRWVCGGLGDPVGCWAGGLDNS